MQCQHKEAFINCFKVSIKLLELLKKRGKSKDKWCILSLYLCHPYAGVGACQEAFCVLSFVQMCHFEVLATVKLLPGARCCT